MSHNPRTVLPGYELVEITNRIIHRCFLLKPDPELKRIIAGAVGKAQRIYGVKIHAFVFLSNHYHLLASFKDAAQKAGFVGDYQKKIAKEVKRRYGWSDKVWAHRYRSIPVDPDEQEQVSRLRYILANSCKEGLVRSPLDWPGASSAKALTSGRCVVNGIWPNRTEEWRSNHRREGVPASAFAQAESIYLTPLPCWAHRDPEMNRQAVCALIEQIETETRARHRSRRTVPLGPRKVSRLSPLRRPRPGKELLCTRDSPAPRVHAPSRAAYHRFLDAYEVFLRAYRIAADRLKRGIDPAVFPVGCFPPGLPFVRAGT